MPREETIAGTATIHAGTQLVVRLETRVEMYPVCPYRNVDAAFARFYDVTPQPLSSSLGDRMRQRAIDLADGMHRLLLKRRERTMVALATG